MKDYKIVSAQGIDSLEAEVRPLLEDGWIPLGGIAAGVGGLYQAMVLPKELHTKAAPKK